MPFFFNPQLNYPHLLHVESKSFVHPHRQQVGFNYLLTLCFRLNKPLSLELVSTAAFTSGVQQPAG